MKNERKGECEREGTEEKEREKEGENERLIKEIGPVEQSGTVVGG